MFLIIELKILSVQNKKFAIEDIILPSSRLYREKTGNQINWRRRR
jgi:hypothetical protein